MSDKARAELAPTGVLRAGINLSNFLLVTGKSASGDPQGVSPDMAAEIAKRLGASLSKVKTDIHRGRQSLKRFLQHRREDALGTEARPR